MSYFTRGKGPPDGLEANPAAKLRTRLKPVRVQHTIASLGLNIDAARAGKLHELVPDRLQRVWDELELPDDINELGQIASLPCVGPAPSMRYIRKAKRVFELRIRALAAVSLTTAQKRADNICEDIGRKRKRANEVLAEITTAAAAARASLTDLYGLARSGHRKIMEDFVNNSTQNDEDFNEKAALFQKSSHQVFSQVARLGQGALDPEGKQEAEDAVFQHYLDSLRGRVREAQLEKPEMAPGSDSKQ